MHDSFFCVFAFFVCVLKILSAKLQNSNVKLFQTQKHTFESSQGINYTVEDCFCFVCVAVESFNDFFFNDFILNG